MDYELWVGPAEFMPYQENRFHYNWHWWHNFGTGDVGNDGTHEIDYARWGLGVEGLPNSATAIGGKYVFDDDQQFPDTATCAFEWSGDGQVGHRRQLIFEMRLWDDCYPHNCDSGTEFHGTAGRMLLSKRGKIEVYGERGQRIENPQPKEPPQLVENHQADFLDAIRNQRRPNADVAIGHDSVALVHLANAAVRLGRTLQLDPQTEQARDDEQANQLLANLSRWRTLGHSTQLNSHEREPMKTDRRLPLLALTVHACLLLAPTRIGNRFRGRTTVRSPGHHGRGSTRGNLRVP